MVLLAVLFPIAIYLGALGWINRRPHGLVVSGPWDFAGVLFAGSGFLLLGGPAVLSSLTQTEGWRTFWVLGKLTGWAPADQRLGVGRIILFGSYFVIVVSVAAIVLWRRRRLTAVYNVDPRLLEVVLHQILDYLQLPSVQTGNVFLVEPGPGMCVRRATRLEVETSRAMCHVSLWWDPPGSLVRREVEARLRQALAEQEAPGGAVGDWLLIASSGLFFLLLLGMGILAWLRFWRP